MSTKTKLLKTVVDKAQPDALEGKDVWIWDTELEGFGLRVKPSGRKVYVVRYRLKGGTQGKANVARASDMPPEKARDLARKVLAQAAEGIDPHAQRKAARAEAAQVTVTVGQLFQSYVDHMTAKGKESAIEVERALLKASNNAADALGRDQHPAKVTPDDVVKYIAGIFKRGKRGAADKHRSYIRSAYAWAIKSEHDYTVEERQSWGIITNPAADLPRDAKATTTRTRSLTAAEIHKLWRATSPSVPGFTMETGGCVRILLACGQRVQETLRLEGSEIDLEKKVWHMPAHKTKGKKRDHFIPLPDAILPTLELLITIHGDGPLFPGRFGVGLMNHRSVMQAIERWYLDAEVPAFQTRDIRRTWKSRAGELGISKEMRDLIQQHAKHDTGSKHYDVADYLPQMRAAMAKWDAWLTRVAADPAPVLPIAA